VVASVTVGGGNRVMVMFGTGQKAPFTGAAGDVYTGGSQTFYGIWDWDMTAWNAKAISNARYVALTGTQAVNRTKLLQQMLTSTSAGSGTNSQVIGYRNLPVGAVVCWQGSTTCSSGNSQYGWLFDLPSTNEQIIYNPALIGGAVVVNTAIPPVISASTCNPGLQTGWTMAFDPASGGGIVQSFFPDASGNTGTVNGSTVGGIQLNGVGTPTPLTYNGQTYLVTQTVTGTAAISKVYPPSNAASRVSWKEIRY
jgi:type IV pilus assembly protein PilY1